MIIRKLTLADSYVKMGQKEEAIQTYKKVIDLYLKKFGKSIHENSLPLEATRKMAELYGLTDKALQLYRELAPAYPGSNVNTIDAENMINLIENYCDFEKKPLELFVSSEKLEDSHEKVQIFSEILKRFPNCKLAPYVKFLIAEHFGPQNNKRKIDTNRCIEIYSDIVKDYSDSFFPETWTGFYAGWIGYVREGNIAAMAQLRIANLYEKKGKIKEAIKAYEKVISKYPNQRGWRTAKFITEAYFSLLDIYTQQEKEKFDTCKKAEEICNKILSQANENT